MNAQVMRVLMVFGVLRLISASTDALRRGRAASTHRLNLRVELQRLVALRALRLRLLVVKTQMTPATEAATWPSGST